MLRQIQAAVGSEGVEVAGLDLRRSFALCESAHSMVSVDTGPAHAAAALKCPTVALFGASDPLLYRPGGVTTPAIALVGAINGRPNILGIQPPAVIAAWRELNAGLRSIAPTP
jgi:heptosyltransferase-2/heptosyltransferase-3